MAEQCPCGAADEIELLLHELSAHKAVAAALARDRRALLVLVLRLRNAVEGRCAPVDPDTPAYDSLVTLQQECEGLLLA